MGQIQYKLIPEKRTIYIYCIFVPDKGRCRRGIAKKLLFSLIEDAAKPCIPFGDRPASALVTRTFPGEEMNHYPARLFFTKMGFRQANENPDLLYYPLEDFSYLSLSGEYTPREDLGWIKIFTEGYLKEAVYAPQNEDMGKAPIIYGPSFCPFSYVFLKRAEQIIGESAPEIPSGG